MHDNTFYLVTPKTIIYLLFNEIAQGMIKLFLRNGFVKVVWLIVTKTDFMPIKRHLHLDKIATKKCYHTLFKFEFIC